MDTVILAHGIINPWWVMAPIGRHLRRQSYRVIYWDYPSRIKDVQDYARDFKQFLQSRKIEGVMHFVGFSLGSIIMRYHLSHELPLPGSRFVMIGPPNHGCEMAEYLYRYKLFRWVYGMHAIRQLFASDKKFHQECGIPAVPFGIIAGGKGDEKGFYPWQGEDNDGTVSVSSTRLEGAKDFVLLPCTHMGLLLSRKTKAQVAHFLKNGRFGHD